MTIRPPLFLLTGLCWLLLSSALGVVLLIGMIAGVPMPPQLRLVHVHGALVGGVAQMIFGALLAFLPALLMTGRDRPESHPWLYAAVNGGAVAMVAGFGANRQGIVAAGGALVLLAALALLGEGFRQVRSSLVSPPLNLWFYGMALVALVFGLGLGLAMALRQLTPDLYAVGRLAHIHLNLLGFVTLTIIGTMHNFYPTILQSPLYSPKLARWTFFLFPAGVLLLAAGFISGHLLVQIGAGAVILAAVALYGYNVVRTWSQAGRPGRIASDHFLLATFYLTLAVVAGILVSVNYLWEPTYVPFGKLHLVAYTHLALVGFILQTIFGALSHLLPVILSVTRVKSHKKRGPYLAELTALVEQGRALQVGALNLGLIFLLATATLVWQFSLRTPAVQVAAWSSAALLALALGFFAVKIVRLLLHHPEARPED